MGGDIVGATEGWDSERSASKMTAVKPRSSSVTSIHVCRVKYLVLESKGKPGTISAPASWSSYPRVFVLTEMALGWIFRQSTVICALLVVKGHWTQDWQGWSSKEAPHYINTNTIIKHSGEFHWHRRGCHAKLTFCRKCFVVFARTRTCPLKFPSSCGSTSTHVFHVSSGVVASVQVVVEREA